MNNKELQKEISQASELSNEKVERLQEAMIDVMLSKLCDGISIGFQSFGILEVRKKEQRLTVNPMTKKRTITPPKLVLAFKPGKSYKEKIKGLPRYEDK